MTYYRKDDLLLPPNLQLPIPSIPDFRKPKFPPRPSWVPAEGGTNAFSYPALQPEPPLFDPHLWDAPTKPNTLSPLPIFPLPAGPSPFPDPVQKRPPLEVDPSERNPYNDLDYSPFLITQNVSTDAAPQGGLLGRLLGLLAEQAGNGANGSGSLNADADATAAAPLQEPEDRPVRILARRIAR